MRKLKGSPTSFSGKYSSSTDPFPRDRWLQPWKWQRLAHVCRRWRHIIFDSPRSLNLQLFCTYGTPV
ncbi:hypothetical protein BGW80DRAFT_1338084, partial [Lactifluus volemus]